MNWMNEPESGNVTRLLDMMAASTLGMLSM